MEAEFKQNNELFDYPTTNEETAIEIKKKAKEKEIAQENISNFTARKNIRKKNAIDEDLYLKNYMQDSMRREAKLQNQMFTQQRRKEIATRDYNKNLALNKYISIEKLDEKHKDSYNFDLPENGLRLIDQTVLAPTPTS